MIVIDIKKNANEPQWREFAPGITVLIAPWTRTLLSKVKEASTPAGASDADPELWNKNLYREIIRDVPNLVDTKGAPVVCTDEVKDLLCECEGELLVWAIAESKRLGHLILEAGEDVLKNSKRSPGGKAKGPTA